MKKAICCTMLAALALAFPSASSAADSLPQWTNSFGMTFSLIPAGKSVIGRYGWAGVEPRRDITISTEFGMATTEVTQGQWKAVMGGKNPSEPFLGNDLPVNRVSWNDAQTFVKKLNELDAPRRYRLPTSAEWEHAYRAGSQATWITGDGTLAFPQSLREYEWFGPDKKTHPVAQKKPNDWGLYDMGGNVREWVQDFWQHDYYGGMPGVDPAGPAVGNMRVWRGGSYEDAIETCSFVSRDGDKPTKQSKWIGFRVVLEGDSLRSALGGDRLGLITYGKLPLMITRNCPVKNGKACADCGGKSVLTDRMGISFPVICGEGYSQVLNSRPIYMADRERETAFSAFYLLYFTTETPEECEKIISAYENKKEPEGEFTRGLYYRGVE